MLRKFLIPTVIVSILLLLTTLTFITKTEATSVVTLTTKTQTDKTTTTTEKITTATSKVSTSDLKQFTETSAVNKFLNNAAAAQEETTTSLLPLQPPLNVTSTTLSSFKLNQKHQQQHERQQRQQQQQHRHQEQYRHVQVVGETQQFQKHLLNDNVNDNKEIKKKNLDHAFVTVTSPVDVITPEPTSTHAYIPFDLDYSDPTEEKALKEEHARQSTINEVLTNLFPKGFSDIFRFSYAEDTEPITTTTLAPAINLIRSTPAPFKPMPTINVDDITEAKPKATPVYIPKEEKKDRNMTFITMSTSVTRETRREVSPGHTEIVVEKIITEPNSFKSSEEFRDGSNSISKDELLRINRAAKEASVLPSLLMNPQNNNSKNGTDIPIVILNDNDSNEDFIDASEDDNQIAESQNIVHHVYHKPPSAPAGEGTSYQASTNHQYKPPAESTNFHATQNHQYNVRIIHDDTLRKAQDEELKKQQQQAPKHSPSYQSFVEQSKQLQNSLQEAPSRKFLKNFHHPILSEDPNPAPVPKGNFHYEHNGPQSHIQSVPPAAQLQYVQYQQQQPKQQLQDQQQKQKPEQYQQLHTHIIDSQQLSDKDVYQTIEEGEQEQQESKTETPVNLIFVTINTPAPPTQETPKQQRSNNQESLTTSSKTLKSPFDFVAEALSGKPQQIVDHQTEETENKPKPSNQGYTFVEVQKSINIHNKLITEKDGRLIEQHETIYPEHKYRDRFEPQPLVTQQQQPQNSHDYVSLSQNPIHVEQFEEQGNPELAASFIEEHRATKPASELTEIGPIQQSNLVQESHIVQTPNYGQQQYDTYNQNVKNYDNSYQNEDYAYAQNIAAQVAKEEEHHGQENNNQYTQKEEYPVQQNHLTSQVEQHEQQDYHDQPQVQIPYALPPEEPQHHHDVHESQHHHEVHEPQQHHEIHQSQQYHEVHEPQQHHEIHQSQHHHVQHEPQQHHVQHEPQQHHEIHEQHHHHQQQPLVYQEIIEKHIPIPYAVPEPVPVHIEHFIDRPYPVETIVEKPYPVEKVVEKVVEKHIPVTVEKIVEKPVEKIVKKYIDRPVAVPIKIPVAIQMPYGPSYYGSTAPQYPISQYGGLDHATPFAHSGGGGGGGHFARVPNKVLQSYYAKMIKKLVPQMQQIYKKTPTATKPKTSTKQAPKAKQKPNNKISDILFDLKPPPAARPRGTNWDLGARYQYDYNTLPLDLSASSSVDVGRLVERPGQGYKTNFDEFQRWRNGHSLKRSPDFGRNLHVEYGFKPPLVPSVEIDDKGMPLKAVADLTKGKEE